MTAIQRVKHAVAISVGWRGSNTTDGEPAFVVFLDVAGLIFFRGIADDRSGLAHLTTRTLVAWVTTGAD
jgi:hypothetical protein